MKTRALVLTLSIAVALAAGCKGPAVRPGDADPALGPAAGPTGIGQHGEVGPPLPPGGVSPSVPAGAVGPQPTVDFEPRTDGYVLVLGPGLARAMAYLGVLREIEERQLPVSAVVGVEMGALIAGVWAASNLNNLEWEMHKFGRKTLLDVPMFGIGGKIAEGKSLYSFLDKALKVTSLQKMRIPLLVVSAVRSGSSESVLVERQGEAKDIIRGAMGIPGILKSYTWESKERVTAALETPFPVSEAKALSLGRVVCVDAVGRGDNFEPKNDIEEHLATLMRSVAAIGRRQLKECDVVLSIPTDGIGYFNFEAKADLIYQGKLAVRRWQEQSAH